MTATLDQPAAAVRRGRGRPRGSTNKATRALYDSIALHLDLHGGELVDALAATFEDPRAPISVRLAAARALFGALAGRAVRAEAG